MPEVSNTVLVAAPLEVVYAAAKDVEGLAGFIDDVESIAVTERTPGPSGDATVTAWVALLSEFKRKLRWTEQDQWDDAAHTCVFSQVAGDWDAYEGEWRFAQDGDQTAVTLVVRYEYDVPLIGALLRRLVLKKTQDSVDGIQAGLKRRAEEQAAA